MTEEELKALVIKTVREKTESDQLEIKKASKGFPESLYDTLSSFSNTLGGVILFGIDEKHKYEITGVYDVSNLQLKVSEQALEMIPPVRVSFSHCEIDHKMVLACEVPQIDPLERPCYYKNKGMYQGSYLRVGDKDLRMSEFEVYQINSFKNRREDELRVKDTIHDGVMNELKLAEYLVKVTDRKPHLASLDKERILQICGIENESHFPTLAGMLCFSSYPQVFAPNLDIVAVRCATDEYGVATADGVRFIDNKRLDGTIPEMLKASMSFVMNNIKKKTIVNPKTLKREDTYEYPLTAVREVILNALVHRDYSVYTETSPVQIQIFDDRLVVISPGGLYGRVTLENLGKNNSDIRNPYIAEILELMEGTENRYTGIPTIRSEMKKAGLRPPVFEDRKDSFAVTLYNSKEVGNEELDIISKTILKAVKEGPKSKEELASLCGYDISHPAYFVKKYVLPLVEKGYLEYVFPDKPKSKKQRIKANGSDPIYSTID